MHFVPDGSRYVGTLGATTEEVQASATTAAAANNVAIAAVSGKRNFIRGFTVTGSGATTGLVIEITITGPTTTLRYSYAITAGALLNNPVLDIKFKAPIAASADNTAITVNVPSFGAGNTNCSVVVEGFRI